MIRVMVMDEEEQVGITINNILHEQGDEFQVAAMAGNGETARQQLMEMQPEIVISELNVRDWSAVQLMAEIQRMEWNTQVIVLSDAIDYHSVRSIWKAGAFDYLSKSDLNANELIAALRAAKQEITRQRQRILRSLSEMFRSIQAGRVLFETEENILRRMRRKYTLRKGYRIAYLQIDSIASFYQLDGAVQDQFHNQLPALLQNHIASSLSYEWVELHPHAGVLLFAEIDVETILATLHQIIQEVKTSLGISISMTLGDVSRELTALPEQFKTVWQAHAHHFYTEPGSVIKTWECHDFSSLMPDMMDYHNRMWEALKIRDFKELIQIHQELLEDARRQVFDPQELREYEVFIVNNMEGNERKKGVKPLFDFHKVITSLRACEKNEELDAVLRQSYADMEKWYQDETTSRYGKDIVDIINFVEANYTQKLTLGMLAETFGMNESYLSRMFKNQTGKNLIYFINEKKMNKARELLKDPNIMVKEAAYAVGYDDQFYFNKLFKRFFGVSPTEYRRRFHHDD